MKKLMKGVFMLIGAMFLLTGCGAETIDVFETMNVEFTGTDGYGQAKVTGAYEFEDAILNSEDSVGGFGTVMVLDSCLEVHLDKEEGLSNGDKVTVTVDANNEALKEYGYKFKTGTKTFEVSGLKEAVEIDLFENCSINYEGIAPYTTAKIDKVQDETLGMTISYRIQSDSIFLEQYKLGDTFVVEVTSPSEEELLENGFIAKSFTKEYTITDIPFYPASIAEIPESLMKEMREKADELCSTLNASRLGDQEKLLDFEYLGEYYLNYRGESFLGCQNIIDLCYKVRVENPEGIAEYYWNCEFYDLYAYPDGTGYVDLSDYGEPVEGFGGYGYIGIGSYSYLGYTDKEHMFQQLIEPYMDRYDYESTVAE